MPGNELRKGEFIVRIVFSCIKSQNSGLKSEGSLNSDSNMTQMCPRF